ncbi:MAG: metallophosphoesterase [Chthoniobacter sp.]|uniref:metallophosphoesterase family protein n=1 Tax=Chthoniobacter sp. TaxID=2510640 RepID=UPI0032A148E9
MNRRRLTAVGVLVLGASLAALFAADPGGGQRGGQRPQDAPIDDVRFLFKTDVPAHPLDVVLGRPTKASVTASVLSYADREGLLRYGPKDDPRIAQTAVFALKAGEPAEVAITGLQPDTRYYYRLSTRLAGGAWVAEPERAFQTQRPVGRAFTFTVQADPHLDYNTEPALYLRCLANALADQPDFHIDLGDTFMTDKHRGRETAAAQYVAQRYYFGQIAHSTPLFLVLGNHDGESGRWLDGTADNLALWSNAQRKRYFPNPVPDAFYSGNATRDPHAGLLEDYYAWEWGDALFVVLDPFWYSTRQRGGDDNWSRTLGREQYDWLSTTLAHSRAKFRFVFLHHLVGGLGKEARGGMEAALLYEWGGRNPDGTDVFQEKRPGWPMPIHELLVKNHVSIVFHGHDHLYAKQDLDGIIYQEVPQPGQPRYDNTRSAAEYGYKSGTFVGSSGHLRVKVDGSKATVEYVRAFLPADETGPRQNGAVAQSYEVLPR